MSIETDLTGRADVFVRVDGGIHCLYSVEVTEEDEDRYQMEMTALAGECRSKVETTCTLDGDELDCDAADNGAPPLVLVRK